MATRDQETLLFQFHGRAERLPDRVAAQRLTSLEASADPLEADLRQLSAASSQIATDISSALKALLPSVRFESRINFRRGSIEWSGTVSASSDDGMLDAAASIGGLHSLPQTISTLVSSIVGKHLPYVTYSQPTTTCTTVAHSTRSHVKQHFQTLKDNLDELAVATIDYFAVQVKYLLRRIRNLPYLITGTNPYAFSVQGGIVQSTYSKISVRLFGWASLFVVIYVTIASQKIVREFGIFPNSELAATLFSLITGVIVFFCDRFILSFPKVRYRVELAVNGLKVSKANGLHRLVLIGKGLLLRVFAFAWMSSLFLTLFRLLIALIVSGLLLSTVVISMNEASIKEKAAAVKNLNAEAYSKSLPEYFRYQTAVQEERRAYFKVQANLQCRQIAARGVKSPEDSLVRADQRSMAGAYVGSFGVDLGPLPPDFDCGVRRPEPCARASSTCPEFGRITRDQVVFDRQLSELVQARRSTETALQAKFSAALESRLSSPTDFSTRLQALALVYIDKQGAGTLLYEVVNIAPFLLVLLIFELLPAVAKIFFPATAYDHLLAKEDLFHRLNATIPKSAEISELLESHFSSSASATTIDRLRELDNFEKEKDDELKLAVEKVLEKSTLFFDSFVSVLGFPLTALITLLLLLLFLVVILNTLFSIGRVVSPLFDIGALIEKLSPSKLLP